MSSAVRSIFRVILKDDLGCAIRPAVTLARRGSPLAGPTEGSRESALAFVVELEAKGSDPRRSRLRHRECAAHGMWETVQGHSKSELQFSKYVPSTCQLIPQLPNYRPGTRAAYPTTRRNHMLGLRPDLSRGFVLFKPQEALELPKRTIHPLRRGVGDREPEKPVQRRDHQRGDRLRIEPLVDEALSLSMSDPGSKRAVPGPDRLLEDGGDSRISAIAQSQLAHHQEQLRLLLGQSTNPLELGGELLARPGTWGEGRPEPPHGMPDDPLDQGLLAREVVVEGGDVHPHLGRDVPGA